MEIVSSILMEMQYVNVLQDIMEINACRIDFI
jgi:hypothetical protein